MSKVVEKAKAPAYSGGDIVIWWATAGRFIAGEVIEFDGDRLVIRDVRGELVFRLSDMPRGTEAPRVVGYVRGDGRPVWSTGGTP